MPTTRTEPGGSSGAARLARIAFASLALATLGALAIAEHLKSQKALTDSAVWRPSTGTFDPKTARASVSLECYYRDHISVSIVSAKTGQVVALIARDYPVEPYRHTEAFPWTGRNMRGSLVPAGTYVVQVHFDRLDRTTQVPQAMFVVKYRAR